MLKSLTTSRNVTSVCHFRVTRVTRPNNHLANIKAGWEKVATDIFTLDDKNYLCTVHYYSGYFEMLVSYTAKQELSSQRNLRDILSHMEHLMNC